MNLPTLGGGGVPLRAIPKLAGAEICSDRADAFPDVISAQAKWAPFGGHASQCHVNVWMFGVVVRYGHPFERSSEVLLHLRQQIASQLLEIGSVAKFGRYNDFPKAFIAGPLPTFE